MEKGKLVSQISISKRRLSDKEIEVNFKRKLTPACPICSRKIGYWDKGYVVSILNKNKKYNVEIMMVCSDKCLNVLKQFGDFYENVV